MSVLNLERVKSLHTILRQVVWSVEEIKAFLQRNPSGVNKVSHIDETPLFRVLSSEKCSTDLVRVLLDYGAEVNCRDFRRETPLMVALFMSRGDAIIKALLEKGADARFDHDVTSSTTFCYALRCGASKDVVKLLLDAGFHPNECREHVSALHCAISDPPNVLDEGILEILKNSGADLLRFGHDGQSPLCLAIQGDAGVKCIEWLLRQGCSLNACTKHNSVLQCATTGSEAMLRSDVIELISKEGTGSPTDIPRGYRFSPLESALSFSRYETQAIKILLDHPGVDFNVRNNSSLGQNLLHFAVENSYCEPRVVELLIERGVKVDGVNCLNETPLHEAIVREFEFWKSGVQQSIISILLKNNSPVNAEDDDGKTPLRHALETECHPDIVQLLLSAGAQVRVPNGSYSFLRFALNRYLDNKCHLRLDSLKLLVKYYFLENPEFNIERLTGRKTPEILATELKHLADECAREVQIMKSTNIDDHRTLLDLIRERSLSKIFAAGKSPAVSSDCLNNILGIMADNTISHFMADITATVGKSAMEIKLQELQVYSIKKRPVPSRMEEKVILIYDCVLKITPFLSHEDTMRLILAFYIPTNQTNRNNSVTNDMKRKFEEYENCYGC